MCANDMVQENVKLNYCVVCKWFACLWGGDVRAQVPRLKQRAYYVKPCVNTENVKLDKQGGCWIQWHASGGIGNACAVALRLAGCPLDPIAGGDT